MIFAVYQDCVIGPRDLKQAVNQVLFYILPVSIFNKRVSVVPGSPKEIGKDEVIMEIP